MSRRGRSDDDFLRVRRIQMLVGKFYGVTGAEIRSDRRTKSISRARTMAIGVAREAGGWSYPELAELFGLRDHTSTLAAHRRFRALVREAHGDALKLLELVRGDPDCCPPSPPQPEPDRFVEELVSAGVRRPGPPEPVERVVVVPAKRDDALADGKLSVSKRKASRRGRPRSSNNVIPIDRRDRED